MLLQVWCPLIQSFHWPSPSFTAQRHVQLAPSQSFQSREVDDLVILDSQIFICKKVKAVWWKMMPTMTSI
jgi:hypothetical protein